MVGQIEDVSNIRSNKEAEQKCCDKIAKRAMWINLGLTLLWFTNSSITAIATKLTLQEYRFFIVIPNIVVNGIRNPLIAKYAFKVNEMSREESRETRRKREIAIALEKREMRRQVKDGDNINV